MTKARTVLWDGHLAAMTGHDLRFRPPTNQRPGTRDVLLWHEFVCLLDACPLPCWWPLERRARIGQPYTAILHASFRKAPSTDRPTDSLAGG